MEHLGLLILRVAAGGIMLFSHGWGKMMKFGELSTQFPDPIGLGSAVSLSLTVFSEVFCAVALVIGLGTRFVSFPLLITMLVAAFVIHAEDPFAKKEMAILYASMFGTLLFTGGGKFSIDSLIFKKK
jgi:putative oxidoreductase